MAPGRGRVRLMGSSAGAVRLDASRRFALAEDVAEVTGGAEALAVDLGDVAFVHHQAGLGHAQVVRAEADHLLLAGIVFDVDAVEGVHDARSTWNTSTLIDPTR